MDDDVWGSPMTQETSTFHPSHAAFVLADVLCLGMPALHPDGSSTRPGGSPSQTLAAPHGAGAQVAATTTGATWGMLWMLCG